MKRFIATLAIATSVAAGAASTAAWAEQGNETAAKPKAPDTCVFSRTINNWQVIDNSHIAVWAPTRRNAYVVELAFPISGLKFENSLGFQDRNNDGQFCSYGGDSIIVGGPLNERAMVRSVRKSSEDEIKQLTAAAKEASGKPKTTLSKQSDMKSDKTPDSTP